MSKISFINCAEKIVTRVQLRDSIHTNRESDVYRGVHRKGFSRHPISSIAGL